MLDDPLTEGAMARYDDMVARRAAGEPLQYVLGHWGFRHLDLMVNRRVLIPRPETEQVVEVALAELDRLGGRDVPTTVVDLGTGSGAIALAVATERVRTTVWATDASEAALAVARANLAGVGRAGARVTMVAGDWFGALPAELRGDRAADRVEPAVRGHHPGPAGGGGGLGAHRRAAQRARRPRRPTPHHRRRGGVARA